MPCTFGYCECIHFWEPALSSVEAIDVVWGRVKLQSDGLEAIPTGQTGDGVSPGRLFSIFILKPWQYIHPGVYSFIRIGNHGNPSEG